MLEGAIPLAIANAGIRSALGQLFTWKLAVLIAVVVLSVLFYRPFCKWICPLGAFYALIRRRSPGGRLWQTVGVVLFGLFLFVPLLVFGTAKR